MDRFLTIFNSGGPMMFPILIASFIVCLLFLERFLYLHKAQIRATDFVSGLKVPLKKGRLLEALTICEETPCPVSRVLKAALLNCESSKAVMVDGIRAAALLELPLLQRRLSSIILIAKIAPLMGLLGTVLALTQIFYKMGRSGSYVTAAEFSDQIYAALISTASGLFLCLLAWVMYAFLLGRVRAIAHDIDWASNEMILFIEKGMPADEHLKMLGNKKND